MESHQQQQQDEQQDLMRLYQSNGTPQKSRDETTRLLQLLTARATQEEESSSSPARRPRPPLSNVHGEGPIFVSDLPASCSTDGIIVGIDEAGRGSVCGPMVYGMAFWHPNEAPKIQHLTDKLNDSKQLTAETRERLYQVIQETPHVGFGLRILHASEISRNMLRPVPYNLNAMSHDSAMQLIRCLLDAGIRIRTCYVDTVGNPDHYKRRLEKELPAVSEFVVESKADAKYSVVSAASIMAKVARDALLENWTFSEPSWNPVRGKGIGSGYPSDPTCKEWLAQNLQCKVFGYPDFVRFSWAPIQKTLRDSAMAVPVRFAAEDDDGKDEEDWRITVGVKRQQEQMSSFLGKSSTKKSPAKRLGYFEKRRLQAVTDI